MARLRVKLQGSGAEKPVITAHFPACPGNAGAHGGKQQHHQNRIVTPADLVPDSQIRWRRQQDENGAKPHQKPVTGFLIAVVLAAICQLGLALAVPVKQKHQAAAHQGKDTTEGQAKHQ